MSISQNPASTAEDGLSPVLLMIEEFSYHALNDYMGAICMLHDAANEVGDSTARAALGCNNASPGQNSSYRTAILRSRREHSTLSSKGNRILRRFSKL
jgi:hypothetical protein